MSFTRFHADPNRIQKTNLETSAMNDYTFNVPGNTNKNSVYFSDPHLRMQKNGTTLCRNMVNIESELRTMDRILERDHKEKNNYMKTQSVKNYIHPSIISKNITKESRATNPVWTLREVTIDRPQYLFHDPQMNTSIPFESYLDTNILEKDYYKINCSKKI